MAFQLKRTTQATGKVVVSYADAEKAGVERQDSFDATFEIVSQPEYKATMKRIDDGEITVDEVIEQRLKGVNGEFKDFEGQPLTDFAAIKEGLLSQSNYVTALWRAWTSLQLSVKQKNSGK